MELSITWGRAARIWWAFFWRSLLIMIPALLAAFLVAVPMGLLLGLAGATTDTVRIAAMPVGFLIALAGHVLAMKLILGKDFGEFRLVLLSKVSTVHHSTGGPVNPTT